MEEQQSPPASASHLPQRADERDRERRRNFASDLGRLFELGFNAGLLATITQRKNVKTYFGSLYENDLCQIRFPALAAVMYKRLGLLSPYDRNALEHWLLFFIQKGYLAGMNFVAEYLSTLAEDSQEESIDLVYLQCSCSGKNSLDLYDKNERTHASQVIAQLRAQHSSLTWTDQDFQDYSRLGHFLNADTLLLFRIGTSWRVLCIDESVFSIGTSKETADLTRAEHLKHLLSRELHYTRAKSAFANLSIDADQETASTSILSEHIQEYFTAFKREDKESIKFIQAASYAWSFHQFLLSKGVLSARDSVIFNVVGYTDRGINTMSVNQTQVCLLKTCADIYQKRSRREEIDQARDTILETIRTVAARSFQDGQRFMNTLVHLADQGERVRWLVQTETLDDFINTRRPLDAQHIPPCVREQLAPEQYEGKNILDIHQALTEHILAGQAPYVFLTGHPGIGKTTAIVNFLKTRESEGEGFLFLYISPRKQVNLDIIKKFRTAVTGKPACTNLCAVTTHSIIIHNNYGSPTVHYYAPDRKHTFESNGATFIHADSDQAKEQRTRQRQFAEIQEGLLVDKGEQSSGVLNSLSRALQTLIDGPWPQKKALVATVAIQSLKRTANGTTLKHLERVFQGIANGGRVIPAKMQQLAQRIRHIFVMIDEVTGDESGVEFLSGIHELLSQYGLLSPTSGINTKIIVADASIVDPKIIKRHLESSTYEPHKIYFGHVAPDEPLWPISLEETRFKRKPALVINANAYPATPLHLTYKIGIDVLRYDEEQWNVHNKQLRGAKQQRIMDDILDAMNKANGQVLVYIQDKKRLTELIQKIRKAREGEFRLKEHYLAIHANISEDERKAIEEYQDDVQVIFMTASASRGLSFERTRHILVDIPRFEIEQNLMEILQVIYRGRGNAVLDQQEKWLTFYLTDHVVYTDEQDKQLSVRECMLHLLNVLVILKTSIMTRIAGYGVIGARRRFRMIPIGGKSVFSSGETFTSQMSRLIKELDDLSHTRWEDRRLRHVSASLKQILGKARLELIAKLSEQGKGSTRPPGQSYLKQRASFGGDFASLVRQGFHLLIQRPIMEQGYLSGSLLVVPTGRKSLEEDYWMAVDEILRQKKTGPDLLSQMYELSKDSNIPPGVQASLKRAMALLKTLSQIGWEKTPHYTQDSTHTDRYYAFPLAILPVYESVQAYFASKPLQETGDGNFRQLLAGYVHALYPVDSLLPIDQMYDEFPFLVFRSFNLAEARKKMFTDHYLFMSHEFNILNLLLSSYKE